MPSKISAKRMRSKKHQKLCRRVNLLPDYVSEIRQRIQEYNEMKANEQLAKELAEKERQLLALGKRLRDAEKFNYERDDEWTGLRVPPDDSDEGGRNWTTYFCLRRLRKEFPSDIMILINKMLNWVPAGCWSTTGSGCTGCGIKFLDSRRLCFKVCSWRCYESTLRDVIISDYEACTSVVPFLTKEDIATGDPIEYLARVPIKFNYVFYGTQDEIINYKVYWVDYELNRYLDACDRYGYYDWDDQSSMSSMSLGPDIQDLEEKVRMGLSPGDNEDDIWQNYRSHWDETLVHVFCN